MERKQWIKLLKEKHKYKDHLSLTYVACGELAELLEHENVEKIIMNKETTTCNFCNHEIDSELEICPFCGEEMKEIKKNIFSGI